MPSTDFWGWSLPTIPPAESKPVAWPPKPSRERRETCGKNVFVSSSAQWESRRKTPPSSPRVRTEPSRVPGTQQMSHVIPVQGNGSPFNWSGNRIREGKGLDQDHTEPHPGPPHCHFHPAPYWFPAWTCAPLLGSSAGLATLCLALRPAGTVPGFLPRK